MQTSYAETPAVAIEGMIADSTLVREVLSKIIATRQLAQIVVTTVENSGIFTVTINGTAYAYTADGSATKTEIRDGLIALIAAGDEPVVAAATASDTFTVESTDSDAGFTITRTNPSTGVLTLTELVAQEEAVGFGKLVCWDDKRTVDTCRLPRQSTDITAAVWGVAVADTSKETRVSSPYGGYSAGEAVPVLSKGRIWVISEDAVTSVGTPAYARYTATGSQSLGAFRTTADSSTAALVPRARFVTLCSAGGLVQLELNI